ncbi:MAG TPA: hypothetical protein VGI55_11085 [Solirubrobacteraceae bacterium]|jgi:hypothetical protein
MPGPYTPGNTIRLSAHFVDPTTGNDFGPDFGDVQSAPYLVIVGVLY